MNERFLYHITSLSEWNEAQNVGEYKPRGYDREGFIHCSYDRQLLTVAHRFYKGQDGLVILIIKRGDRQQNQTATDRVFESSTIENSLVEENLEGGTELYPHLYCPLPIDSVIKAVAFPCDARGGFTLPQELTM